MSQQKAYLYIFLHLNHTTFNVVHENRSIPHRRKCRSAKRCSCKADKPVSYVFPKC